MDRRQSLKVFASALVTCVVAGVAVSAPFSVKAGSQVEFDQAKFEAAKASGAPVVMQVHAWWCGTCRTQDTQLKRLMAEPEFASYKVFKVNFDSSKKWLKEMKVTSQSTLIVYKGKTEVKRVVGETNKQAIKASLLLAKS